MPAGEAPGLLEIGGALDGKKHRGKREGTGVRMPSLFRDRLDYGVESRESVGKIRPTGERANGIPG
jgi:hypothetical protein